MHHAVARKRTVAGKSPGVFVLQSPTGRCIRRLHDRQIKVYQVTVVRTIALTTIDAVGVMADAARSANRHDVAPVQWKALVIEDALPAMASITQCIGLGRFDSEIASFIVAD